MRRSIIAVLLIGLVAGLASSANGVTRDVSIEGVGAGFSPPKLTIELGDQVRWTNADGINHTSTSSGATATGASMWSPLVSVTV